jgi:predicted phage terminase large subunit-like protein
MTTNLAPYREAMERATSAEDIRAIRFALKDELESSWEAWLRYLFPTHVTFGFAPHHREYWEWLWAIEPDRSCPPGVGIWSRGGAKSTSVELGLAALAARQRRNYVLYVCGKESKAIDHVGTVTTLLESSAVADLYPDLGERLTGKFGNSKGWRANRRRTASGFTLDAVGLDSITRGAKLDEERPDLIVLDDIDTETDTPATTQKKIDQITRAFLPALASDGIVLAVQNVVIPSGVFARLAGVAEQPAEFLQERILFGGGVVPAAYGLELGKDEEGRSVVVAGEPTWEGQSLEVIQAQARDWGPTAFRVEAQHEVELRSGGQFNAWEWMEGKWLDDDMGLTADRCRAWDQAGTEFDGKNDPDWTVGVRWAYDIDTKLYRIEDVVRFRHSAGTRDEIMRRTADEDAEEFGRDRVPQLIEQRPGDLGRDEADRIVREVFQGHRAYKISPIGTKDERAQGLASAMENGLLTIVRDRMPARPNRGTVQGFLAEHEAFPLGDHDDQVDAAAHGFNWMRKRKGAVAKTNRSALLGARTVAQF